MDSLSFSGGHSKRKDVGFKMRLDHVILNDVIFDTFALRMQIFADIE